MIVEIINFLHMTLIIGLLLSVIIPNKEYKILCLTFLLFIILQFIFNQGKCGLTQIEYMFKKDKYEEGFIYRLVTPVITIPECYFNKYLYLIHIILILSLGSQIYL